MEEVHAQLAWPSLRAQIAARSAFLDCPPLDVSQFLYRSMAFCGQGKLVG
jgi:hypothetical protein